MPTPGRLFQQRCLTGRGGGEGAGGVERGEVVVPQPLADGSSRPDVPEEGLLGRRPAAVRVVPELGEGGEPRSELEDGTDTMGGLDVNVVVPNVGANAAVRLNEVEMTEVLRERPASNPVGPDELYAHEERPERLLRPDRLAGLGGDLAPEHVPEISQATEVSLAEDGVRGRRSEWWPGVKGRSPGRGEGRRGAMGRVVLHGVFPW